MYKTIKSSESSAKSDLCLVLWDLIWSFSPSPQCPLPVWLVWSDPALPQAQAFTLWKETAPGPTRMTETARVLTPTRAAAVAVKLQRGGALTQKVPWTAWTNLCPSPPKCPVKWYTHQTSSKKNLCEFLQVGASLPLTAHPYLQMTGKKWRFWSNIRTASLFLLLEASFSFAIFLKGTLLAKGVVMHFILRSCAVRGNMACRDTELKWQMSEKAVAEF